MFSFGRRLVKKPLKSTAEVGNTAVGTTAEKIDENLENKELSNQLTTDNKGQ